MTIHEILEAGWVKKEIVRDIFIFEKKPNQMLIWDSKTKEVIREFQF